MPGKYLRRMPVIAALCYAAAVIVAAGRGFREFAVLAIGYAGLFGATAIMAGCIVLVVLIMRHRVPTALSVVRQAGGKTWSDDRGSAVWVPFVCFVVTMAAYTLCKQRLLPGVGFAAGPYLATVDRAVLGRDAWQITHLLLSSPWAS